jgi:molecular chaperone GrpE
MKKEESMDKLKKKVSELKAREKEKGEELKECKEKQKTEDTEDKKKIKELTETLQHLQAEFENYRKYIERTKIEFNKYAKASVIEALLPVLDSFELALKNTTNKEEFIKGIELIYSQLYSMLEKEGLSIIDTKGKLDPTLHEVLLKEESDKDEDTILEELQKGYFLNGKVLRHSKVKVSKCSKEKPPLEKS